MVCSRYIQGINKEVLIVDGNSLVIHTADCLFTLLIHSYALLPTRGDSEPFIHHLLLRY